MGVKYAGRRAQIRQVEKHLSIALAVVGLSLKDLANTTHLRQRHRRILQASEVHQEIFRQSLPTSAAVEYAAFTS